MMEQSEIRITFNDSGVDVQVESREGLKPSDLIDGVLAYVSTVAQILKTDETSIMAFSTMLLAEWKKNPEAVQKESVEIRIPKGLNLSGKEGQALMIRWI
jgi:hypothetical protein